MTGFQDVVLKPSDSEFAAWLRSMPREKPPEEVEQVERQHDVDRGPYVPHGGEVHHSSDESRH